jgi:hypothetical protein
MPHGNICEVCKREIKVSINKGTGICSEVCRKKYKKITEEKNEVVEEQNRRIRTREVNPAAI